MQRLRKCLLFVNGIGKGIVKGFIRCLSGFAVLAWCAVGFANPVYAEGFDHSHALWEELLQSHVVDHGTYSQVQYQALKRDSASILDEYLQSLSSVPKSQFDQWPKPQRLAFLINAYNAFTVKLIIEHYPLDSIKDIGWLLRSPWKTRFFTLFGSKTYLDHIEHDLIRGGDYDEPRIHFALVCASTGCPKLQPHAYTAERLESMLESAAKTFLRDRSRNRFDPDRNTLYLSSIFKWYGEDFVGKYTSVGQFVAGYLTDDSERQQRIRQHQMKVEYLDYNWSLNDAH